MHKIKFQIRICTREYNDVITIYEYIYVIYNTIEFMFILHNDTERKPQRLSVETEASVITIWRKVVMKNCEIVTVVKA